MIPLERIREYEERARINPIIGTASIGSVSEEIMKEIECFKKQIKE